MPQIKNGQMIGEMLVHGTFIKLHRLGYSIKVIFIHTAFVHLGYTEPSILYRLTDFKDSALILQG